MMTDEQFQNAYDEYSKQANEYSKNFPREEQAQQYGLKFGELCNKIGNSTFCDLIAFQRWKHKRLSKIKQDRVDEVDADLVEFEKNRKLLESSSFGGVVGMLDSAYDKTLGMMKFRKKEHFVMKLHSENMIKLFTTLIERDFEHAGVDRSSIDTTLVKNLETVNQGIHLVIEVLGEAVEKNVYSENTYIQLCKQFKEEYEMWAGSIQFFTNGSLSGMVEAHRNRFGYDME